ncbi:MAG TPA: serine protease [Hyphomicrobiaceae bacterium]
MSYFMCIDGAKRGVGAVACARYLTKNDAFATDRVLRDCIRRFEDYIWEAAKKEFDDERQVRERQRREKERRDQEQKEARALQYQRSIDTLPRWASADTPRVEFVERGNNPELPPTAIFKAVAPSVYIVKAAETAETIDSASGATGTAVAVSGNVALTNCHIIKGYAAIMIYPPEKRGSTSLPLRATPLKADLQTDRCLLSVSGGLEPIRSVRKLHDVEIGERVYTIGNPKGLANTLGDGLVSGLRELGGITMIQTSAPVSPGSSGGALVDAHGALLGITAFIVKDAQNLNFAIGAEEFWRN